MKNSVFGSTYNLLEKNIFNTLTKKIAGNLVPLLFLQALSLISFYLCIGRVREILSASDAVGKEKFLFLSSYMQFNFWMFVLSIAVAVFTTGFLSFLIIRPMKKAIEFLRSFCDSLDGKDLRAGKVDLGKRIPVMTVDEIGEMFNTYNCLFEKMNNVFKQLQNTSDNIYGTIKTLTESSEQSTDNSHKLSDQSMSIAAAAEEMSQTIVCVAENSSRASGTSESAKSAAVEGKGVADEAVEYIKKVHKSTVDLSTMVMQLDNRAAEIGNIVMVITEIADQTNLLALNAAIEAARAGEEGRGFAVVADEVRKLAEKTIKATKEISGKIQAVQDESVQTARSMGIASEEVTKANEYIIRVGESLTSILNVVTEGRDEVTQIASAVEEQSAASSEIASNAEQSSAIAQHNKEMAGSIQSEITRLKDTSEFLINLTSRFDTGK